MKRVFALLFLCFLSSPALAAKVVPVWTIVPEESHLTFEAVQMGAPFEGEFKNFTGLIRFSSTNLPGSSAEITIPIDGVEANNPDRNKYIRMKDWFDAASFPNAKFVTTSIEPGLESGAYVAKGNLTIRDVTLPVTLPFTLAITSTDSGGSVAKMEGETTINRLDFGVGQGDWKDTKTVENPVKVRVSLTAREVAAAP